MATAEHEEIDEGMDRISGNSFNMSQDSFCMREESMDLSDDSGCGGVYLDDLSPAQNQSSSGQLEMSDEDLAAYHQSPSAISYNESLWKLPFRPMHSSDKRFRQLGDTYPAARLYHQSCHIITKRWRCMPEDGVPERLQIATPYSLALLLQIRMLASYSRREREQVHDLLLQHWSRRINAMGHREQPTKPSFHTTQVTGANPAALRLCETTIQENVYGLTLEDVANAAHIVRARKRKLDARVREVREAHNGLKELLEKKARKDARSQDKDVQMAAARALEGASMSGLHQADIPHPPDGTGADTLVMVNDTSVFPGESRASINHEARGSGSARRARQDVPKLMNDLGRMRLDHRPKRAGRRRRNKLQDLAASMREGQSTGMPSLPSERVDLGSISSLHANKEAQELADGLGTLDLARLDQHGVPETPPKAGVNVSVDEYKPFRGE